MTQEKFSAVMGLLVPQIVHLIAEKNQLTETEASAAFNRSQVYELLEEEATKMSHDALSPISGGVLHRKLPGPRGGMIYEHE